MPAGELHAWYQPKLDLHSRAAADLGISSERIANLPSWRESTLYSRAECAALDYCEALTQVDQVRFAAAHDAVAMLFDSREIAEIAAVVADMRIAKIAGAEGQRSRGIAHENLHRVRFRPSCLQRGH